MRPTRWAPTSCSRPRASAACATCRSRPTRSTARSSEGTFTETSPLEPSSPYSATKAGADLLVGGYQAHLRPRGARSSAARTTTGRYQYPEKLIPLMVLNALHGDPLPVYGDGMQVRNWIWVEDFARAIGTALDARRARRGLQRRRPRRVREHRGRPADHRADRPERRPDRARHRPPGPRPPLLALLREGPRARLGAAHELRRRPGATPSPGTASTPTGGSRSARAPTASTTSASTGARCADVADPS